MFLNLNRLKHVADLRRDEKSRRTLHAIDGAVGTFERARRALVPDFDAFYAAALSCLPRDRRLPLKVLDLGAGTGIFSRLVAAAYPHSRIIVSDVSQSRLDEARTNLGRDVRFEFVRLDAIMDPLPKDLDAVVSSMAIHHFEHADKRVLFGRVHRALKADGVFVNADQVSSGSKLQDEKRFATWLADVNANGVKQKDLKAALKHMEDSDQDAPLDLQVRWLEETGFRNVDVHYYNYFWAVMSGRK
jgi:tRNA (cmo5U34)-methyltransferase